MRISQKSEIKKVFGSLSLVILFAVYAILRWNNESLAFEKAKQISDTKAYIRISGEPLLTRDFWTNARPAIYPLLLKILQADLSSVSAFQSAFSILTWFILASSVAYSLTGFLRWMSFGLILVLSLDRHIAGWDVVILTESVSLSLMVLFISGWIWLLKRSSVGKMIWLSLIAFLWAFSRDTNAWIIFFIAGLICLAVVFWGAKRQFVLLAVVFFVIFVASNLAANLGSRWVFPFQNVLAQRVLTNQEALLFFSNCGMPITPELMRLAGGNAASEERAFFLDPALEPYRTWLYAHGKSCYIRWLFVSPLQSLYQPFSDFAPLIAFENVNRFFPRRYEPILPWYAERLLYPKDALLSLWVLISIIAAVALTQKTWQFNPLWMIFAGLCLLIYPHLFIVWHGDTLGTPRHALSVSVEFMLSFWLCVLLSLERVFLRLRVPNSVYLPEIWAGDK